MDIKVMLGKHLSESATFRVSGGVWFSNDQEVEEELDQEDVISY